MTLTHTMVVLGIDADGMRTIGCDLCSMLVLAKPGYTKVIRLGDPDVGHSFISVPDDGLALTLSFDFENEDEHSKDTRECSPESTGCCPTCCRK